MRKNKNIKLKLKNNIYHDDLYYPNKDSDYWYHNKNDNWERTIRLTL